MLVTVYKGRTRDFTLTVRNVDGDIVPFSSGDVMRLKIGRVGSIPLLDLDSAAVSSNGSSIQASNPSSVSLAQEDLDLLEAGIYTVEVGIVDDSDSDKFKHAETGVFSLIETMLGERALT